MIKTISYGNWMLLAAIFLLIVPVEFLKFDMQASGLSLVLLLIPFAMATAMVTNTKEALFFKLALIFSLIAIISTQLFTYSFSVRPFLSMLYFFAPVSCYFLATKMITSKGKMELFLKWGLIFSFVLAISVFLSIFIQYEGQVRIDGVLSGTYFGMSLSGAYGVHSLVAHYLLLMLIVFLSLHKANKNNKLERTLCYITLFIFLYILMFSLSREIILALLIMFFGYLFFAYGMLRATLVLTGLTFFVYVNAELIFSSLIEAWATKLDVSLSATDYESLSSGRGTLQQLALDQIISRPLTGTGFYGYALDYESFGEYDDLSGWSPHNYYLTAAWKMGIGGAVFYFLFWFFALKKLKLSLEHFPKKTVILLNVFLFSFLFCVNMLWDALLAPNVMGLFSFTIGMLVTSRKFYMPSETAKC